MSIRRMAANVVLPGREPCWSAVSWREAGWTRLLAASGAMIFTSTLFKPKGRVAESAVALRGRVGSCADFGMHTNVASLRVRGGGCPAARCSLSRASVAAARGLAAVQHAAESPSGRGAVFRARASAALKSSGAASYSSAVIGLPNMREIARYNRWSVGWRRKTLLQ